MRPPGTPRSCRASAARASRWSSGTDRFGERAQLVTRSRLPRATRPRGARPLAHRSGRCRCRSWSGIRVTRDMAAARRVARRPAAHFQPARLVGGHAGRRSRASSPDGLRLPPSSARSIGAPFAGQTSSSRTRRRTLRTSATRSTCPRSPSPSPSSARSTPCSVPPRRSEPEFHVLFVGKLIPLHGLETILAAARLVPDVPFVIAGEGQLAPLLSDTARERRARPVDRVPRPSGGVPACGLRTGHLRTPARRPPV